MYVCLKWLAIKSSVIPTTGTYQLTFLLAAYRPVLSYSANSVLRPIQTLWEWNVLFQEFPYHLNVNATLYCKYNAQRILTPGDWIGYNIELAE